MSGTIGDIIIRHKYRKDSTRQTRILAALTRSVITEACGHRIGKLAVLIRGDPNALQTCFFYCLLHNTGFLCFVDNLREFTLSLI
jgi:hypothetical protein